MTVFGIRISGGYNIGTCNETDKRKVELFIRRPVYTKLEKIQSLEILICDVDVLHHIRQYAFTTASFYPF